MKIIKSDRDINRCKKCGEKLQYCFERKGADKKTIFKNCSGCFISYIIEISIDNYITK